MRLADKSILLLLSSVFTSVLTLATGMVLVRYLSQEEYGTYLQVNLYVNLVASSVAMGLPYALYHFLPKSKSSNERKSHIFQVLLFLLFVGIMMTTLTLCFSKQLAQVFNNDQLLLYYGIFAFCFIFILPSKIDNTVFIALEKINLSTIYSSISAIFASLFILIPLFLGLSLKGVLISILCFMACKFVVVLWLMFRIEGGVPQLLNLHVIKEHLKFSIPIGLATLIGLFRMQADKLICSNIFGAEGFAIYARGVFEIPVIGTLGVTISNICLPKYVKYIHDNDIGRFLILWRDNMRRVALIILPVSMFLAIFATDFITLLYTDTYAESGNLLRIYLLSMPLRIAAYRSILTAIGETGPVVVSSILGLIVNVSLSYLLSGPYGLMGLAIASFSGAFVSVSYTVYLGASKLKVKVSELFPIKSLLLISGIAIFVGIGCSIFHFTEFSKLEILFFAAVVYFPVYLLCLKIFRILPESDWEIINRYLFIYRRFL